MPETTSLIKYWKHQKIKETEQLILSSAGLWMEAYAANYIGIPGKAADFTVQVINRSGNPVKLDKIYWPGKNDTLTNLMLKPNELYTFKHREVLSASLPYSNPYWLNNKHKPGMYTVNNKILISEPENDPAASIKFEIEINDIKLQVERAVVYKYTDPVKAEIYRPFEILPPATVNFSEKAYVFGELTLKNILITLRANADSLKGILDLKAPAGWEIKISEPNFLLNNKNDEITIQAIITLGKNSLPGNLSATLNIEGKRYSKSIKRIEYDHIPYQFMLSEAEASLVNFDLKKGKTDIGYIPGAGDDVPAALRQVGYNVTELNDEMLNNFEMYNFDAIVTGVRAYNTNQRLQVHYNKLMNYVKKGGNLIVQYNTNNRIGPLVAKIAPYPFNITRERVTDENAEPFFLNPQHNALTYPNPITTEDFEGWVQERGIYFTADSLDKNYETILSFSDHGEKPKKGSVIIAKYGKGNFVYTGLAFFRQLPAGVPGAFRLFANLLALPEN